MKVQLLITAMSALLVFCTSHETTTEDALLKDASNYFPAEKAQVLVVGTFHFDYPGLDVINHKDEDKIDLLVEPKKSEVTEVVEYIKKFKPTKIAIEAFENWNATVKLREYAVGSHREKRDERYQLGMRVATELGIDTLYSIDAESFDDDLIKLDSQYFDQLFANFDFESEDPYNALYKSWFAANSAVIPKVNLLDYLKHINTQESHQYGYGAYLVGDFKLGESRGADILSIWWYNRNLRIFRNIQSISTGPEDRILVIFGNGHAEILRQLLESSPEFEFVEFDSL